MPFIRNFCEYTPIWSAQYFEVSTGFFSSRPWSLWPRKNYVKCKSDLFKIKWLPCSPLTRLSSKKKTLTNENQWKTNERLQLRGRCLIRNWLRAVLTVFDVMMKWESPNDVLKQLLPVILGHRGGLRILSPLTTNHYFTLVKAGHVPLAGRHHSFH